MDGVGWKSIRLFYGFFWRVSLGVSTVGVRFYYGKSLILLGVNCVFMVCFVFEFFITIRLLLGIY